MNTHDDGGPAFPVAADVNPDGNQSGIRLRDYFAAAALQGQLSCAETMQAVSKGAFTAREFAGSCYEWADAMLAARKEAK